MFPPKIFNLRTEGLEVIDRVFVPPYQFDKNYTVFIDFESDGTPITTMWLKTLWADGRISRPVKKPIEASTRGITSGTIKVSSVILANPMMRHTEWWVEDAKGRVSNKLTQAVVIYEPERKEKPCF